MNLIVVLKYNPFFVSSASANRWLTLLVGLEQRGAKIVVLVFGGHQSEEEYKTLGNSSFYNGIEFQYVLPLRYKTLWQKRINRYILEPIKSKLLLKILIRHINKLEGLVWIDATLSSFKLSEKLKFSDKSRKLFVEMSEFLDIYEANSTNALQFKAGKRRKEFFETKVLENLDGFALMTKTLYSHYNQMISGRPKLLHLPMTVDLERFTMDSTPPIEFKNPYLLYVGVMNNAKDGIDVLIKAFSQICSRYPNLNLYLVGPYTHDTQGQLKLIKDMGLENRVFWMKEYPREAIPAIVKNAKLLTLPRPDSKQAQGGFPTKLGEYLASGVPVCATSVGELSEYLEDEKSVFFAQPGSVDSFANALERALSNPDLASQVGKNGRLVAEKSFNKDIQAGILFNFLKTL